MSAGICTLCEQRPATTTWGFPVCQPCAELLTDLDANLKAEEAADPELAEKGRRAEKAFEAYRRKTGDWMEPELHVVLGMDPDAYEAALEEGRRTHSWPGMDATKDPRWHSHPLLGITGHAHSSVEGARRYHGHQPELAWSHEPVFVAKNDRPQVGDNSVENP